MHKHLYCYVMNALTRHRIHGEQQRADDGRVAHTTAGGKLRAFREGLGARLSQLRGWEGRQVRTGHLRKEFKLPLVGDVQQLSV